MLLAVWCLLYAGVGCPLCGPDFDPCTLASSGGLHPPGHVQIHTITVVCAMRYHSCVTGVSEPKAQHPKLRIDILGPIFGPKNCQFKCILPGAGLCPRPGRTQGCTPGGVPKPPARVCYPQKITFPAYAGKGKPVLPLWARRSLRQFWGRFFAPPVPGRPRASPGPKREWIGLNARHDPSVRGPTGSPQMVACQFCP